jgi:multidrug resistance efflux pump
VNLAERRNFMDKKEEYTKKLEAQLKEWKAKIDILEARGAKITSEAKTELMREIKELRQKKGIVKEKWNELQKVSGDSWDTMKVGVEKAAAELKGAMDRVISRFK